MDVLAARYRPVGARCLRGCGADQKGLHALKLKTCLGEQHAATRLTEHGDIGHELQGIARQRDFAMHRAAFHMQGGQMQLEVEPGIARGTTTI